MNRKTILGISFAAAFAVTMIFAQSANANGTYRDLEDVAWGNDAGILSVEIETGGDIPLSSVSDEVGAFGYGVFTNGEANNVLALTTHVCASDHFSQSQVKDGSCGHTVGLLKALGLANNNKHNGPEMHAHILDLKAAGADCTSLGNSDFEVDLESTVGSGNNVIAMYTIEIEGEFIRTAAPLNDLDGDEVLNVASYGITPFATKQGTITNLCLTDVEFLN